MSQICITKIERDIIIVLGERRSKFPSGMACFVFFHEIHGSEIILSRSITPTSRISREGGETGDRVEKGRLRIEGENTG